MSRLEAGFIQPKKDWCDLNELIFTAIKNIHDESNNHKIHFEPNESLPLFKFDRGLIEQILHNLLHNALLYTPENSKIIVEVSNNQKICIIKISDNGPGFPEKEIDMVFDKFYRLSNTSAGGTGLGLSIVKGFTESMGGQVYLKKLRQGGAKFTIEIPCEFSQKTFLEDE